MKYLVSERAYYVVWWRPTNSDKIKKPLGSASKMASCICVVRPLITRGTRNPIVYKVITYIFADSDSLHMYLQTYWSISFAIFSYCDAAEYWERYPIELPNSIWVAWLHLPVTEGLPKSSILHIAYDLTPCRNHRIYPTIIYPCYILFPLFDISTLTQFPQVWSEINLLILLLTTSSCNTFCQINHNVYQPSNEQQWE